MFDQNQNHSGQPEQNTYYTQVQPASQEQRSTANYVNYYSDPNEQPKKKGGGRTFLKIVAGLAAIAIVSVSSIELYKIFGKDGGGLTSVTDGDSSAAANEGDSGSSADENASADKNHNSAASWVTMASPEDALSIPDIVDKALPSVVGVSALFEYAPEYNWGFYSYQGQTQQASGTGTGIILNEEGYIITNAHCIYDSQNGAGKAVAVTIVMGDEEETEYEAQVVGYDLETDLAVLKVEAEGLVPAEFGDSDTLRVGELVVAIGNPLGFELFGTTSCGIVSALNREVTINEKKMTLIQTDTAINSGNSGGPLLNSYGQVIGINSAKISSTYSSASGATIEGLGFAIPITDAKEIIDDLINYGYVTGRPQLGVTGVDVSEADSERYGMPQGVYVHAVTEGSAAELAGLQQGDVITKIQDQRVLTMDELNEIKNEYDAGDTVKLEIYRSGQAMDVELVLQEVEQTNQ